MKTFYLTGFSVLVFLFPSIAQADVLYDGGQIRRFLDKAPRSVGIESEERTFSGGGVTRIGPQSARSLCRIYRFCLRSKSGENNITIYEKGHSDDTLELPKATPSSVHRCGLIAIHGDRIGVDLHENSTATLLVERYTGNDESTNACLKRN
jgi:hypothetical protein